MYGALLRATMTGVSELGNAAQFEVSCQVLLYETSYLSR